jgi:hypothetical protein
MQEHGSGVIERDGLVLLSGMVMTTELYSLE